MRSLSHRGRMTHSLGFLMTTYCVPGTILGSGTKAERWELLPPRSLHSPWGRQHASESFNKPKTLELSAKSHENGRQSGWQETRAPGRLSRAALRRPLTRHWGWSAGVKAWQGDRKSLEPKQDLPVSWARRVLNLIATEISPGKERGHWP